VQLHLLLEAALVGRARDAGRLSPRRRPGGDRLRLPDRQVHHAGAVRAVRGHSVRLGNIPQIGGDFVSINLACLDDLDPAELIAAPVTYRDGRNDNWWHPPAETRHL